MFDELINKHFYVDSATHERTRVAWVAGVTLFCVAASLLITYLILSLSGHEKLPIIFIIAGLVPAIIAPATTWIIIGVMIKVQALEELHRHRSTYDDLSGLLTRRSFLDRSDALLKLSARNSQPLSFATLDLDYFKKINDEYGHAAGDEVIRIVAGHVSQMLRSSDLVGRLGGEEFAIALPGTASQDAVALMEQLRLRVAGARVLYREQIIQITVSIGIAVSTPETTLEELMRQSDEVLYQAKSEGRNRVRLRETPSAPSQLTSTAALAPERDAIV